MDGPKQAAVTNFLSYFHTSNLDMDKIRSALAENARWQAVVPLAKAVVGRDAICAELDRQYKIYADCAAEILHTAINGNLVFTERVDRVRLLSDDREVVTYTVGVFELDDDNKITSWREYWDALDIAGQMGLSDTEMRSIMQPSG